MPEISITPKLPKNRSNNYKPLQASVSPVVGITRPYFKSYQDQHYSGTVYSRKARRAKLASHNYTEGSNQPEKPSHMYRSRDSLKVEETGTLADKKHTSSISIKINRAN